ncbi:MAG: hypothetical protein EXQ67_01400 [Thermoleophilia bacterium]|nr:hypothetical protein [Thermoleophilia bacterium]
MRRLEPLLVLLGYAVSSVVLIGRFVLRAPHDAVVGSFGADQGFFAWSLVHWVEVLAGNQAPFLTDRIDAPMGFNLAWATTIPGPALLLAPLTALAGPLVTYNVLAILAPALAAWSAYLLCRHITQDSLAAIIGGWIFGFSSYVLGETLNHLNLALVAVLPLIVLVVIRLVDQSLRPRRGAVTLAGLIALQFLIFTEVAATATVIGCIALLAAIVIGPSELRLRIVRVLPWIAAGYALAIALVSPLLIAAFLHPNPIDDRIRPDLYPLDLKNLVVPTVITWVGGARFQADSLQFVGNLTEQLAYLGPVLILVALGGIWRWRYERFVWVVVFTTVAAIVLSFGEHLTISGDPWWSMPWQVVARLPLIQLALPTRIVVYVWLGIALLGSLFVTRRRGDLLPWFVARLGLVVVALICLLPTPRAELWRTDLQTPAGIESGVATAVIPPDAVVLILPYSFRGNGMYWQSLATMRYRMAGGYSAAAIPLGYSEYPVVAWFYNDQLPANPRQELLRYLAFTGTSWVLVDARAPGPWAQFLREAGGVRSEVGGVVRYRFDPAVVRAQVHGA